MSLASCRLEVSDGDNAMRRDGKCGFVSRIRPLRLPTTIFVSWSPEIDSSHGWFKVVLASVTP